jgi:hypothetical protein
MPAAGQAVETYGGVDGVRTSPQHRPALSSASTACPDLQLRCQLGAYECVQQGGARRTAFTEPPCGQIGQPVAEPVPTLATGPPTPSPPGGPTPAPPTIPPSRYRAGRVRQPCNRDDRRGVLEASRAGAAVTEWVGRRAGGHHSGARRTLIKTLCLHSIVSPPLHLRMSRGVLGKCPAGVALVASAEVVQHDRAALSHNLGLRCAPRCRDL